MPFARSKKRWNSTTLQITVHAAEYNKMIKLFWFLLLNTIKRERLFSVFLQPTHFFHFSFFIFFFCSNKKECFQNFETIKNKHLVKFLILKRPWVILIRLLKKEFLKDNKFSTNHLVWMKFTFLKLKNIIQEQKFKEE